MGEDAPQAPMDRPEFMLAPLSMIDAKYQMWKDGIAYAKRLLGDLDYDDFNKGRLMSPFPIGVCVFSFLSSLSPYLTYPIYIDI